MEDLAPVENPRLSDVDRLTLEVEALRKCVQGFASLRGSDPRVIKLVETCRQTLSIVARRRKAVRHRDELEQACFFVIDHASRAKIENPSIILQRYSPNDWEAWIDEFDDEAIIGVGEGASPILATRDLLVKVKNYERRCMRGAGVEKRSAAP